MDDIGQGFLVFVSVFLFGLALYLAVPVLLT